MSNNHTNLFQIVTSVCPCYARQVRVVGPSQACADAVQNLRDARGRAARATAQACLKGTIRTAKRNWADDYIEKAQLWEVAAWRHGRRISKVPSLRGPEGLVHTHGEISDILSHRFFADAPPQVPPHFSCKTVTKLFFTFPSSCQYTDLGMRGRGSGICESCICG